MTILIGDYTRKKTNDVIYLLQTNEQMQLKAKSRWDILGNMQDVANHEKDKFYAISEDNHYHRWVTLMDYIKGNRMNINADSVLLAMYRLNNKECIKMWENESEKELKEDAMIRLGQN